MLIKYGIEVEKDSIIKSLDRILNQIFKLLPTREENGDWKTPLNNLLAEVGGMSRLLEDYVDFFQLLCKMESLFLYCGEDDFGQFRKGIFECISAITTMKGEIECH